jgi:hypothetical protein
VEQRKGWANPLVSNCRQPSEFGGVGIFLEVGAHSLNEEDIDQPSDHLGHSNIAGVELGQDMLDRQIEPGTSTLFRRLYVKERRKYDDKRVGVAVLKLHAAADEFRDRPFAASAKYPIHAVRMALDELEEVNHCCLRPVAQDVRVAVRNDNEVARGKPHGFALGLHMEPAAPVGYDIKCRSAISDADAPGGRELEPEQQAASNTYTSQDVV